MCMCMMYVSVYETKQADQAHGNPSRKVPQCDTDRHKSKNDKDFYLISEGCVLYS